MPDSHSDEPHVHTITFVDNTGQSYSFDAPCPSKSDYEFGDLLAATGADSVNALAVDGREMSFEAVFILLGAAGRLPMLGIDYQTPENLMRVLVEIATHSEQPEAAASPK